MFASPATSVMTIHFGYEKGQVLQAFRYHFISRPEIRIMIILVNVFAFGSLDPVCYAKDHTAGFPGGFTFMDCADDQFLVYPADDGVPESRDFSTRI